MGKWGNSFGIICLGCGGRRGGGGGGGGACFDLSISISEHGAVLLCVKPISYNLRLCFFASIPSNPLLGAGNPK